MPHAPTPGLTSDPITVLLEHDEWANRRLLEICLALTDEEFNRPFGIGPGSLRATLAHIVTRYHYWADTIAQRPASAAPARISLTGKASARRLLDALTPAAADFRAVAAEAVRTGLAATIDTTWSNAPTLTKGAAIVHMATHAMHHRAQCLIMLRRLGRDDIREVSDDLSVADWQTQTQTMKVKPRKIPGPRTSTGI
jgi:uncharacterized damage-inducible protein DinB